MSHQFALVPRADPIELPAPHGQYPTKSNSSNIHESITDIYRSYSSLYPNPRLAEELRERDRLLQAAAAASQASEELEDVAKRKQPKRGGIFGFIWGPKEADPEPSRRKPLEDDDKDGQLIYTDEEFEDGGDDSLCATSHCLDTSCIPPEAHSAARFHMASMMTRGERPNISRSSWEVAGSSLIAITGLGVITEFRQGTSGKTLYTSDREDLEEYVAATGAQFQVAYARAAHVGPNLLMVAWGLMDGYVVFYRRLTGDQDVAWEAVAALSPSAAVKRSVEDVFAEEGGSAMLRVSDIIPLVVDTDAAPAVAVAVGRLGGFIELVPLPPRMWYGPEIEVPANRRRKLKRRRSPPEHYAEGKMIDLASNGQLVTALTTSQYHTDIVCMETLRTRVDATSSWDVNAYPESPPAEHVLATSGTINGKEAIAFWAVSTIFTESQGQDDEIGFLLQASMLDAVELDSVGPGATVFADKFIMKHWRRPRLVELREGLDCSYRHREQTDSERVCTISVPVPVVSIRFGATDSQFQIATLDWNGGASVMDCGLLERAASQSLGQFEYDLLYDNDDTALVAMVRPLAGRSQLAQRLSGSLPVKIENVHWLSKKASSEVGKGSFLAALAGDPCRLHILDVTTPVRSIASVPLPASTAESMHCLRDGELLLLGRSDTQRSLSLDAMRPLDPVEIVRSLVRSSKFREALEAADGLNESDKRELNDDIENCKRQMWEISRDREIFATILDDVYVVQQAHDLSDPSSSSVSLDPIGDFRFVHSVALQRVQEARLGSALAIASPQGTQKVADELRGRIIKVGTFELLCRRCSVDPTLSKFTSEFLPLSMLEVARSFARANDVLSLSIVWFRHRHEMTDGFSVLDCIPVAVPPQSIQHLFPVYDGKNSKNNTSEFVADVEEKPWLEWPMMREYLQERYSVEVVLSEDEVEMILKHNPDAPRKEIALKTSDGKRERMAEWYLERVQRIQQFSYSLPLTIEFCRLSLLALRVNPYEVESTESKPVQELCLTFRRADFMQEILPNYVMGDFSRCSLSELNPCDFEGMDLTKILGLMFDGESDTLELSVRFKQYILPSIESGVCNLAGGRGESLDTAVRDYCTNLLQGSDEIEDTSRRVEALMHAVDVTSSISLLSQTSLSKGERLIKDKRILFDLVFSTLDAVSKSAMCIKLSLSDARHVIEALWTLYESLPKMLSSDQLVDEDMDSIEEKANEIFGYLVAADVLSRWPGCNPFAWFLFKSSSGKEQAEAEVVFKDPCLSFCAQVGRNRTASLNECSQLLAALLSDIRELENNCFKDVLPVKAILADHLFSPLLRQNQFHLLAEFLSEAGSAWIDMDNASKHVKGHMNAVFEDVDISSIDDTMKAVMACSDNLGSFFPNLSSDFQLTRQCIDAARFINTVLGVGTRILPRNLRMMPPIDVIELVLSRKHDAIVCDCREWESDDLAALANEAIRLHLRNEREDKESACRLPPLPAGAVFHLAQLLGLNEPRQVMTVKCMVVQHGLAAGLNGAAAAICRTLVMDGTAFSVDFLALPIMDAVAAVVNRQGYADHATIKELCELALSKFQGTISCTDSVSLETVLRVFARSERKVPASLPPTGQRLTSMERLYADTFSEYSADLRDLFSSFQAQTSDGVVDDSLHNALSRYVMFWCIAHSTRPRAADSDPFENDAQSILGLAISLLLHIQGKEVSERCLLEVQGILEEQEAVARTDHGASPSSEWVKPNADIVRGLIGRGFSEFGARRAASMSNNATFDLALQFAIAHSLDAGFDDPIVLLNTPNRAFVDPVNARRLKDALRFAGNSISGVTKAEADDLYRAFEKSSNGRTLVKGSHENGVSVRTLSAECHQLSEPPSEVDSVPSFPAEDLKANELPAVLSEKTQMPVSGVNGNAPSPDTEPTRTDSVDSDLALSAPSSLEAPPTPIAANPRTAVRAQRDHHRTPAAPQGHSAKAPGPTPTEKQTRSAHTIASRSNSTERESRMSRQASKQTPVSSNRTSKSKAVDQASLPSPPAMPPPELRIPECSEPSRDSSASAAPIRSVPHQGDDKMRDPGSRASTTSPAPMPKASKSQARGETAVSANLKMRPAAQVVASRVASSTPVGAEAATILVSKASPPPSEIAEATKEKTVDPASDKVRSENEGVERVDACQGAASSTPTDDTAVRFVTKPPGSRIPVVPPERDSGSSIGKMQPATDSVARKCTTSSAPTKARATPQKPSPPASKIPEVPREKIESSSEGKMRLAKSGTAQFVASESAAPSTPETAAKSDGKSAPPTSQNPVVPREKTFRGNMRPRNEGKAIFVASQVAASSTPTNSGTPPQLISKPSPPASQTPEVPGVKTSYSAKGKIRLANDGRTTLVDSEGAARSTPTTAEIATKTVGKSAPPASKGKTATPGEGQVPQANTGDASFGASQVARSSTTANAKTATAVAAEPAPSPTQVEPTKSASTTPAKVTSTVASSRCKVSALPPNELPSSCAVVGDAPTSLSANLHPVIIVSGSGGSNNEGVAAGSSTASRSAGEDSPPRHGPPGLPVSKHVSVDKEDSTQSKASAPKLRASQVAKKKSGSHRAAQKVRRQAEDGNKHAQLGVPPKLQVPQRSSPAKRALPTKPEGSSRPGEGASCCQNDTIAHHTEIKASSPRHPSPRAPGIGTIARTSAPPRNDATPDRSTLLHRGAAAFRIARKRSSPTNSERTRLIQEGRRLLQQARSRGGISPRARISPPKPSAASSSPIGSKTEVNAPKSPPRVATKTSDEDGWSFDEDF